MAHVNELPKPPQTPEEWAAFREKYKPGFRRANGYLDNIVAEPPIGGWVDLRQPLPKPPEPKK